MEIKIIIEKLVEGQKGNNPDKKPITHQTSQQTLP